jgi:hypothetical protein
MKTPFYIKILLAISIIIIFAQQDLQSCTNKALIEATNKSDVLPENVLFEILSANPDELRKADLMNHLENTPISGGNKSATSSYVYSKDDIANAMGLSIGIKPNPARVYVSVDYTLPISIEQAELQLINTEGKIILTKKVSGIQGQVSIDVRNFKTGAYILQLISDKYSVSESLIID